jgi:hypothetical protein
MKPGRGKKSEKSTIDQVKDLVLQSMPERDLATKALYIDTTVHPEGDELVIGRNKYRLTSDTIVVFVDDEPGVNWGHDCHYLFFNVNTQEVKKIQERFPPSLADVPGSFCVLSKPEGVPGWALWHDE